MKKAVVGIVDSYNQADMLVSSLQHAGVATSDISVLFPDNGGTKDFAYEHSTSAPEGAVAGASVGGVAGGALGLLAGIGALAIPGLGPFLAVGPILTTLTGLATGATVGGVAGALVGTGIPEREAKGFEEQLKNGHILIAVHTDDSDVRERVEGVLKLGGVHDVSATSETSVPRHAHALGVIVCKEEAALGHPGSKAGEGERESAPHARAGPLDRLFSIHPTPMLARPPLALLAVLVTAVLGAALVTHLGVGGTADLDRAALLGGSGGLDGARRSHDDEERRDELSNDLS